MNSLSDDSRKPQPRSMCAIRLCALYCVSTLTRRMPELMQLLSGKSMMRNVPANGTAGLARQFVRFISRVPRPPASTIAYVLRDKAPRKLVYEAAGAR